MHACERCYSRKTRCDRRLPKCSSCIKSQSPCRYPDKRRDQHLQREHLKSVELRLKALEHENEQLKRNASQPQPSIPDSHQSANQQQPSLTEPNRIEAQQSPTQATGSLQPTPGEETRYLGASNGVDFVNVVERVVDSSHNASNLFGRVADNSRVPDRMPLSSIPQPVRLVDKTVAMPLIRSYFDHWHLIFPLLYRPAFMQIVQQMYSDPQVYQQNAAFAFAFDIVLALGSVPSRRVELGLSDPKSHFVRALARLNEVSSLRSIQSLQALLLYCQYGIHASLHDTSSEMWEVLGKATRLCVEIGLHDNISDVLPRCKVHIFGQVPFSVQVEMQRRCFWCYYNLER